MSTGDTNGGVLTSLTKDGIKDTHDNISKEQGSKELLHIQYSLTPKVRTISDSTKGAGLFNGPL
jgi:hypothetical protein